MLSEKQLKRLRIDWTKRINAQSGIIYKYVQKELVNSFIEDLRNLQNFSLLDFDKNSH